jgi:uncharacterized protein
MGLQWQDFLTAIALVMIIEGMLPFLNPAGWRAMLALAQKTPDSTLRAIGLGVAITGLVLLTVVR